VDATADRACARGCGNPGSWWYSGFNRDRPEAWTCDRCYRAEEFAPGHYLTGDRRHFMLTGCNDCCAYTVSGMTMDQVDHWYCYGAVSQDVYEAYCHVWATACFRYSASAGGKASPVIPEVVRVVAIMRGVLALRVTAKRQGGFS
jgi:hypothetical protein